MVATLPFSHSLSLNPSKYDTPTQTQSFKLNCKIFTNGQKVSTILAEWTNFIHFLVIVYLPDREYILFWIV